MKKSIKMLALGLAVIPCALIMTACGDKDDGNKKLDLTGNYSTVEVSDYSSVIEELDEKGIDIKTIADGVKATISLNANSEELGFNLILNSESCLKNYSLLDTTEADKIEAISKNSISLTMDNQTTSYSANAYLIENNLYADLSSMADILTLVGTQFGYQIPPKFQMSIPMTGECEPENAQIPQISYSQIFEYVPAELYGTGFILEKAQSGNDYKIKVTLKGETLYEILSPIIDKASSKTEFNVSLKEASDIVIYVVYNNSNLLGVSIDGGLKVDLQVSETQTATISLSLKMEAMTFSGNINFPAFDESYVKFDPSSLFPDKNQTEIEG